MVRFASGAFACFLAFNSTARAVDLFDFLPLDAFWKSQGVTVSKESMTDLLTDTPAKDVAGLIEQLGSERFIDREKAYASLKNAGGAILPQLEKAAEASHDGEIRQRLGQLIAAISVRAANRATLQMAAMKTVQANKMMGVLPAVRQRTESDNP
ncbi:MAG: hypothetical protein MI757_16930, partial [Pirellulales bacterium]|nr:hypothetical protein [Pirellulales bacterium]